MKRVQHLFVPSLTGSLLVASLLSSCTGIHRPMPVPSVGEPQPAVEEPQPDTSGPEPPPPSRVQVGAASWYGKPFHGRRTASGEIYDMYQPTAAHLTAPLGTAALVTNLGNGQSVRVRINDRGPYKRHRILDLSYEAARQIEMVRAGSARVKVEFLTEPEPLAQPLAMLAAISLDPSLETISGDPSPSVIPLDPSLSVISIDTSPDQRNSVQVIQTRGAPPFAAQVEAYQEQTNAVRIQKTLTSVYPKVWVTMAPESAQPLHRVRLGPFHNREEAERVVYEVKGRGYEAVIVAMTREAQEENRAKSDRAGTPW
jgi:rare lipoprotein A